MTPETVFDEFCDKLRGQVVTDRQLAGNSLSVWVATEAKKDVGYTVWFEPSWHVVGPSGVIAGSRQAQDEEDITGWQSVTEAIDAMVGLLVDRLVRDALTGELELFLTGGYRVRSFITDPRDDFLWRIRDLATGRRIIGRPGAFAVEDAA